MNNYKINCVGMTDEQKRLVQDAFFKLGYCYYATPRCYFNGDYYFAYSDGNVYRMEGEDTRYFENKTHPEITFNELLKLANMGEYMKKSITELLGYSLVRVNVSELTHDQKQLLQEKLFSFGCYWGNRAHTNIVNLNATWYYIGIDKKEGKLGWDTVHYPSAGNSSYHSAKELTYNQLMEKLNMTFTKADLKDGMVVKHRGGCHYSNKYNGLNLVVGESIIQADEFSTLDSFNNDLTHYDDCFSIVEVFEVVSAHRLEDIKNWQLKSIWKRPEQTPQQKVLAELEAKQQELIDQAEKIKEDIAKLKGM